MGRLFGAIAIILLLTASAAAENFFEQLGKGLNRLGQSVERELRQIDRRLQTRRSVSPATCLVYDATGRQTDQERCQQITECRSERECLLIFEWPSGSRTTLDIKPGKAPELNGNPAYVNQFDGMNCALNSGSGNRFCWTETNVRPPGQLADRVEPSQGEKAELQAAKNAPATNKPPASKVNQVHRRTSNAEIRNFFSRKNPSTLNVADAVNACTDEMVDRAKLILPSMPSTLYVAIRDRCKIGARNYENRFADNRSRQAVEANRGDQSGPNSRVARLNRRTSAGEIEKFFSWRDPSRLKTADALSACLKAMLPRAQAILSPLPANLLRAIRDRCRTGARNYISRVAAAGASVSSKANKQRQIEQEREAKRKAEHRKKIALAENITSSPRIRVFFERQDPATLSLADAAKSCETEMLKRARGAGIDLPPDIEIGIVERCKLGAEGFGERVAEAKLDDLIARTNVLPASLEGLRKHNWFYPDEKELAGFPEAKRPELMERYRRGIADHYEKAIAAAKVEIEAAFAKADPLAESGTTVLKLCEFEAQAPRQIIELCAREKDAFNERAKTARCEQAVQTSGASEAMLDMPIRIAGDRNRAWPLREVICRGAANKPGYRFEIDNGSIPLVTTPGFKLFEDKKRVLDVELRVASPRDGRSFTRLLVDIASGENEREVKEWLVSEKIRHADPSLPRYKTEFMIACTLDLMRCE